jgi:hypothetical protein
MMHVFLLFASKVHVIIIGVSVRIWRLWKGFIVWRESVIFILYTNCQMSESNGFCIVCIAYSIDYV